MLADLSTFDKGSNPNSKTFAGIIKHVADYCKVGLKISYLGIENEQLLKIEKKRLESIINVAVKNTRQSYSKLNLPESYRNLITLEVENDFTMGYVNQSGFRAGTCTPFLFYDLDYEVQTPLKLTPFQVMDYSLLKYHSLLDKQSALQEIINQVKQVNGEFVCVFHNYTFSNLERWRGFKALFQIILNSKDEH